MEEIKKLKKNWTIKLLLTANLFMVSLFTIQFFTASVNEEKEDLTFTELFQKDYKIYSLNLPKKLTFADEEIPLNLADVKEKLDRELLVNTYWQSNTLLYLKRANKWFPIIEPILKREGIPDDFKYLALIESGLTNIVSPAGAAGFWQIMKTTGKESGLEINDAVDERYNLEKATLVACNYLNTAKQKFGSWSLAAASYNMGMSGLEKQLEKQQVNNYFDLLLSEETSRYLYRILAAKQILSAPAEFGFNFREKDLYSHIETSVIQVDTTIDNLAVFSKSYGINYKVLKHFNPWLRQNTLPNLSRKVYQIQMPKEEFKTILVNNAN